MKLLVLGNGASGNAAAALAARLGYETQTLDGDDAFPELFTELRSRRTAHPDEPRSSGEAFVGAIVSPGIPLDHPWQVACRAAGIPVKSELEFGCEELRRQGVKLLAVTGSKGKSSVVKLVADALTRAGHRAVPCGNYGRPVCDVALRVLGDAAQPSCACPHAQPSCACPHAQPSKVVKFSECAPEGRRTTGEACVRWAVVEVSSFQLETTTLPPDTFEAAAILNLQEDHLDRHGSVETYHALKRKLLGFAKRSFDFSGSGAASRRTYVGEAARLPANGTDPSALLSGSYFDNDVLRTNGAAAVFLLRAAGLGDAAIASAFAAFEPLPHRMNTVGVFRGVTCIDDSKATSLAALAAGVRMAASDSRASCPASDSPRLASPVSRPPRQPSIRLIAGGLPKGDDPKSVVGDLTARVKKVYLIGRSAEAFASAWSESVACEICGTMDRAVAAAMREAESGETVLLSPGTASFDQFKSFGERGEVFANLVQKEGTDK